MFIPKQRRILASLSLLLSCSLLHKALLPAWVFLCLSRAAGPYVPRSGCNSHVFQRGAALWTIPLRYLGVQKGRACMVSQIRLSPGATIQCPPRFRSPQGHLGERLSCSQEYQCSYQGYPQSSAVFHGGEDNSLLPNSCPEIAQTVPKASKDSLNFSISGHNPCP